MPTSSSTHKSSRSKRSRDRDSDEEKMAKKPKQTSSSQNEETVPAEPNPAGINIKELMAQAQRTIEERKKALNQIKFDHAITRVTAALNSPVPTSISIPPPVLRPPVILPQLPLNSQEVKKQQQISIASSGPRPLILNDEGKPVDSSGKEIQFSHHVPSLIANKRAKLKEDYKLVEDKVQKKELTILENNPYFDQRIDGKQNQRSKKVFKFHEKGKFEEQAQRLRTKIKLDQLQLEISQAAKKTGISSTTKLALIAPKEGFFDEEIPEVEWWDEAILGPSMSSYDFLGEMKEISDKKLFPGVTHLIEHPTEMRPPTEPTKRISQPIFLTKKEQKKMRRINRREALQEKQEKIRLGFEPPPAAKVKISNLMRVLGNEAVQDPTKMEAYVRAQMAKRKLAHESANAARKLTVDEKRAKKVKKMKEDVSLGVLVAVYRVKDLKNPSKKYKVETNCNQLQMSGTVVCFKDCNVIVVEGGPKQQKKFKRLMLTRIKWQEDVVDGVNNSCALVWEGSVKRRSFTSIKFKIFPIENQARAHFAKHGVEQYWNLAYSGAILESAEGD